MAAPEAAPPDDLVAAYHPGPEAQVGPVELADLEEKAVRAVAAPERLILETVAVVAAPAHPSPAEGHFVHYFVSRD
ncbi:MAG: hypothetical protein DHS20C08_08740 [Rhodomicrobium sp.]|nr:MAG: hypothetical protein DHS20C08_08740 [Rhodomicrobium sp.]